MFQNCSNSSNKAKSDNQPTIKISLMILEVSADLVSKFDGGVHSANIRCSDLVFLKSLENSSFNHISESRQSHISQHHNGAEQSPDRVDLVLTSDIESGVTSSLFKKSVGRSNVGSRGQAGSSSQSSSDVRDDRTVQVGQKHHIKLPWILGHLHTAVIDNHFFIFDHGISFSNLTASFQETSVTQFHDVSLVDSGNLSTVVEIGVLESILSDLKRLLLGNDFNTFNNTVVYFML
mmetsp:Transcript_43056/g.49475  ORF Transcript_43056/g.49475 Transcript_43056/m.49475 type:complete len:234 (-) Transcript_43056:440-1141(-)